MKTLSLWLVASVLAAQDSADERELADARKMLAVFDLLELPSAADKTLVLHNPGEWWRSGGPETYSFSYRLGWVCSEDEDRIVLLETNLQCVTHDRKPKLPDDWERFKDQQPKDRPIPGEKKVLEFEKICNELLKEGQRYNYGDFWHSLRGGLCNIEPAASIQGGSCVCGAGH